MSKVRGYENANFPEIDRSKWKTVLIEEIPEDSRQLFLNRKDAVDMYLDGKPICDISKKTGLSRNEPLRLLKRCLEIDEYGDVYGYTALIPYKRVQSFNREFTKLLEDYPNIKEYIDQFYIKASSRKNNKSEIKENNIQVSKLYKKFINKCIRSGIKENEYPFNTKDKGERSLYRYINDLKLQNYDETSKRQGNNAYQVYKNVGVGQANNPIVTRPFHQVQFDGHKIDCSIAIKFKSPEGDTFVRPMKRICLLAIIDVATRVILGHHICLKPEYSSSDVLECIKKAIIPKEKIKFSISGLKYPENGGYHSLYIPETKWAVWDEFFCDNAKANLASNVTVALTHYVKSSITAGPVATPQRRPYIERFFKTLEENSIHRLINTTGSDTNDPRRNKSEENAVTYEIEEHEIEELIEVSIAQYNNDPHSELNGFTPLETMKQRIDRGLIPRIMDESERNNLKFFALTVKRSVCGSIKEGRRPFINYEGVEYRSEVLSKMPDLIGKKLTLLVDTNDLRSVKAYLPDGSELGLLTAKGKWCVRAHSLDMRKEINKLKREKKIIITMYDDPVEIFHTYLSSKSINDKSARNKLAKVNKLSNLTEDKEEIVKFDSKINSDEEVDEEVDEARIKKLFTAINGKI